MRKFLLKRALLCLAMLLCLILAVACAEKNDDGKSDLPTGDAEGNTPEGTTEYVDPYDTKLPEEDFEEYVFRILNVDSNAMSWAIVNVDVAEQTADVVEDAIYLRNRNVEGRYNFTLKEIAMHPDEVNTNIRKMSTSGTDDYDLFIARTDAIPNHATSGYLVDLAKLEYVNLSQPWWNSTTTHYCSIGGKLFFTSSDFLLTDNENVATLAYNTKVAADLGFENADQMYEIVLANKWTWEKFTEMCRAAYLNVDGTGVIDYDKDRFGLVSAGWYLGSVIMTSFNEPIIMKNADDLPYIACKTDRFVELYTSMIDFFNDKKAVARTSVDFNNVLEYVYERDGSLFAVTMLCGYRIMKGMKSDSALLPLPKWNEAQDKYYTCAKESTCISIPSVIPDPERSGFIIEALSAESAKILTPAYYEKALNVKYLRDEGSVLMLDIILSNQVNDIMYNIYNWGGFTDIYRDAMMKNNPNFTSLIERNETRILNAMQKTIDAYDNLY